MTHPDAKLIVVIEGDVKASENTTQLFAALVADVDEWTKEKTR